MDTPEFTTEDAERAMLVGHKLATIALPHALPANEEYELEELALIVQTDQPYASLTDDGEFFLEVYYAVTNTAAAVARAKSEILKDIADGVVPRDITEFDELHDYVDANEYGGLCDPYEGMTEQQWMVWGHVVQDTIDMWIRDGMKQEAVA